MPSAIPVPTPDDAPAEVTAVRALARLSRLLERAAGAELSLAHYRVLSTVAGGDRRASRLAERLALGKPAISSAVEALTRRGLLARTAEAADQRAAVLSLTPAGEALLADTESAMAGLLAEAAAHTADPARTLAVLAELSTALETAHPHLRDRLRQGAAK